MTSFDFHLPTNIQIGEGVFLQTGEYLKQMIKGSKILIITDPGIEKIGLVHRLIEILSTYHFRIEVFNQVRPNPRDTDCAEGGILAKNFDADCILALGGGSVIDAAKAIAVLQTCGGTVQDYAGINQVKIPVTPIVAIPTTAGTGAEVTRSSVITDTSKRVKITIKDIKIAPTLAMIDPELTYGLPAPLTASTGMDALVHAIEAYTCKRSNPIADGLAVEAMNHIYPNLRLAVQDPGNKKARYHMMVGSTIAGMAFSHSDVASVHCMAEAIGGLYDTPHGVANSMFLPYVIEYNAESDIVKHAKIAKIIGVADESMSELDATKKLVESMEQLAIDIKIPNFSTITEVKSVDFDYLATSAFENGSTPSNVRIISKQDYLDLFYKAFKN
ncbi:iron-containing alcohol dehydrogenase [Aquibacillus halophilus]|uniref:Iron-containing alcohol dehydrogenase n=1 Tax=Aquibacillus halophilus TaxID=930132 RepID=A0A6A8DB62_9BACI|nr:iron-containing alcohol dehydrogenase [Aquibacillus halophilus]MRH42540.1 iron-containing alcohol dehydrogenase [Aquibacillus halophilus]